MPKLVIYEMTEEIRSPFKFKQFEIDDSDCTMKVGTDAVLLGAWASVDACSNILDIGTGSGVIAIMMAQRNQTASILGLDVDDKAFNQANENMARTAWSDRLKAILVSIQDYARDSEEKFDLIVSNPPFFSGGTFSFNQDRNNIRHTVKLPHNDLLRSVKSLLKNDGKFEVILPFIEGLRFIELAETYKLYCTKQTNIKPKKDKNVERLLLRFEFEEKECNIDEIIIQNEMRNDFTQDYIDLTKAFYLKM